LTAAAERPWPTVTRWARRHSASSVIRSISAPFRLGLDPLAYEASRKARRQRHFPPSGKVLCGQSRSDRHGNGRHQARMMRSRFRRSVGRPDLRGDHAVLGRQHSCARELQCFASAGQRAGRQVVGRVPDLDAPALLLDRHESFPSRSRLLPRGHAL
jgi:hypothetical protein